MCDLWLEFVHHFRFQNNIVAIYHASTPDVSIPSIAIKGHIISHNSRLLAPTLTFPVLIVTINKCLEASRLFFKTID